MQLCPVQIKSIFQMPQKMERLTLLSRGVYETQMSVNCSFHYKQAFIWHRLKCLH